MKNYIVNLGIVAIAVGLGACGNEGTGGGGTGGGLPQCGTADYVAFDSANHQNQDIRVGVFTQMNAAMTASTPDFAAAKALYIDAVGAADFQAKVQGRTDDHLATQPVGGVGTQLDATIIEWLDFGIQATDPLELRIAKQWVDKTFQDFFFLSVYHEMVLGTRVHWDEAFGYYGSGADGASPQGLAATAGKRDLNNTTNLQDQIFNDIVDGSCELGTALVDGGVDTLDVTTVPALDALVTRIDDNLQEVLAYSVAHEAIGMNAALIATTRDDDTIFVKAAELIPFFLPLERIMIEKGGDSATRAASIRTLIDAMPVWSSSTLDTTSTTWIDALAVTDTNGDNVPTQIKTLIEAEYGILAVN